MYYGPEIKKIRRLSVIKMTYVMKPRDLCHEKLGRNIQTTQPSGAQNNSYRTSTILEASPLLSE